MTRRRLLLAANAVARPTLLAALGMLGVSSACSSSGAEEGGADALHAHADAGTGDAASVAWTIPLEVEVSSGQLTRIYAQVTLNKKACLFMVDTGSQVTCMPVGPDVADGTANYASITLGGRRLAVTGRQYTLVESYEGKTVCGTLGNDVLLASPWELDLPHHTMTARTNLEAYGPWHALPFENVDDFLFARVSIDGTALRLGLDTGAGDALWLGAAGRPGDTPEATQDAHGTPLTFYRGASLVAFGNEPARSVPVLRAPSDPSLMESNAEVGGQIDGLLGLSALGYRRILLNGPGLELRVEPF